MSWLEDALRSNNGQSVALTNCSQAIFHIAPQDLAFANFRHQGQFYVAHISGIKVDAKNLPLGSSPVLESIHVMSEHWEAKTNPDLADFESHSYLRFVFKAGSGVKLDYNQSTNLAVDSTLLPIPTTVLSIEALRSQNQPNADFLPHALVYDFAIAHLFYSQYDRDQSEISDTGKIVEDFPLSFASVQSQISGLIDAPEAILYRAIQASAQYGRKEAYNFVTNNCTNRMFEILDETLASTSSFHRTEFLSAVKSSLDVNVPRALTFLESMAQAKGVELPASTLTDLNHLSSEDVIRTLNEDAVRSENPAQYQTWFPPFVKAHLIGRGLIKPPPS